VALGLFSIVFGIFLIIYAITVIERGPFPANSESYLINGFSFIGLGMGYVVCAHIIRSLMKKLGS
jgi:predicted ATP-grasp superfamily ATP-dependent carboligase